MFDGIIGLSNEDLVAGPLVMNYIYQGGYISKNIFDIQPAILFNQKSYMTIGGTNQEYNIEEIYPHIIGGTLHWEFQILSASFGN